MSILKRTLTTVYSHIDQMVGEIENHDALIKAAINDQRKKLASANIQLAKVQAKERRINGQISQIEHDCQRWQQRAVEEAAKDEQQALDCLQRRQNLQLQLDKLHLSAQEYRETCTRMEADIKRCDEELQALSRKHELLRARQSTNEALTVIHDMGGARVQELETSFERWEANILQSEILNDSAVATDPVEQGYLQRENEQQLRAELAELLKEEKINGE